LAAFGGLGASIAVNRLHENVVVVNTTTNPRFRAQIDLECAGTKKVAPMPLVEVSVSLNPIQKAAVALTRTIQNNINKNYKDKYQQPYK